MKRWVKKVHFIGIGGIGMSGIAEVLLNQGFEVTGSDLKDSPVIERLREIGGKVVIGHGADNLGDADVAVMSSAVRQDNPEVAAARYRGIPVIPRAEMLGELMRMKWGIAVAGSHGKTTATSMIATVLSKAGFDPTAVIGGRLNMFGSNAKLGQGEWMVAEADESDGSFLHLSPAMVIVTNIDQEHMDHYKSMDSLCSTFSEFMNGAPFYGLVIAGIDDHRVRALLPGIKRRVVTYGLAGDADIRAVDVTCPGRGCRFVTIRQGRRLGEVYLDIPGVHNAVNALAALAVAFELGVDFPAAAGALHGFSGISRRFELKGEAAGVMVVDDYAHHPTEVKAVLAAARDYMEVARNGRLLAAFQPHRYTRTQNLWDQFADSFHLPDYLVMTEIYPASEEPIAGITGEALFREVSKRRGQQGRETEFAGSVSGAAQKLAEKARAGDLVMTLGAGTIWKAGEELVTVLEEGK